MIGPLHRRQFIVGPVPVHVRDDWKVRNLEGGVFLSHDPDLRVAACQDRDGVRWHLLGIASQSDPRRPTPLDDVENSHTEQIACHCHSWAGRWILIGANRVHLDACGLLGCFYVLSDDRRGARRLWVSSSASLLHGLVGNPSVIDGRQLRHNIGIDWYTPPSSRFSTIRRLLPSQVLRLSDGHLFPRRLIPDLELPSDYSRLLGELQENLVHALCGAVPENGTIWLPLTGGYDSRLLLAVCLYMGLAVKTYVQEVDHMALGDWLIPARLTRGEGIRHRRIRSRRRHSRETLDCYDRHTAKHSADVDRMFVARRQWNFGSPNDIVLRGHCFEVGRRYFWNRLRTLPDQLTDVTGEAITFVFGEDTSSAASLGLAEWIKWVKQADESGLDWKDRFYIEQRQAGWLSAIEQSLDLVGPERFHPANSGRILALLLRMPVEKRVPARTHVDLIQRLAPQLNKQPFNPPNDYFGWESALWFRTIQDPLWIPKWIVNLPVRLRRKLIKLLR